MLDFFPGLLDAASNHLLYALLGLVCFLAGWFLGLSKGKKKYLNVPRGQYSVSVNRSSQSTATIGGAGESIAVMQIAEQIYGIEKKLNSKPSVPFIGPSLAEKLNDYVVRLKAINEELPIAQAVAFPGPADESELPLDIHYLPPQIPVQTFAQEFTNIYNAAREDRDVRNEFWVKFQLLQLGNRNTSDQRMGRTHETDFRTAESIGDFIAAEDTDGDGYLVVPGFTISVDDTSFRFGGLGSAYDCDFTPGSTYENFKVETPAKFSKTDDAWSVKSKGKLLLYS